MLGPERRKKIEETSARIRVLLDEIATTTTALSNLADSDTDEDDAEVTA